MRLNHIDLHVPDVASTRDFFVEHFGFQHIETRGNNGLAILRDAAELELVLSHAVTKFGASDQVSADVITYHIGFVLSQKRAVDAQYERLKSAGAEIWHEPREIRGGWLFYCFAPGRILSEIGWRP